MDYFKEKNGNLNEIINIVNELLFKENACHRMPGVLFLRKENL